MAEISARHGAEVTLTSVFAIDKMQANQHEIEHALAEGIVIRGGLAPVEVVLDGQGRATGAARCALRGEVRRREARGQAWSRAPKRRFPADLVVSAIGQQVDFTGLEEFDNGKGWVDADSNYQLRGKPGTFVGGDVVRPHLLTTAIGHGCDRRRGHRPLSAR